MVRQLAALTTCNRPSMSLRKTLMGSESSTSSSTSARVEIPAAGASWTRVPAGVEGATTAVQIWPARRSSSGSSRSVVAPWTTSTNRDRSLAASGQPSASVRASLGWR